MAAMKPPEGAPRRSRWRAGWEPAGRRPNPNPRFRMASGLFVQAAPLPYSEEPMLTARSWLFCLPVLALVGLFPATASAQDHPVVALVKSKVKDPAKPFALLVTIKAKAGKEKELEAAFAPCIAATKKEAGCLAYEL